MSPFVRIIPLLALATAACTEPTSSEVIGGPTVDATAAASCTSLAACCPSLPAEVTASCQALAAGTSAAECALELDALGAAGKCVVGGTSPEASTPVDAGHAAAASEAGAPDAGSGVACILLEACCTSASLPSGQVTTCQSIQGAGDEGPCASLLGSLVGSMECGGAAVGSGGACPDLAACCATSTFPSAFATSCQGTVMAGDSDACASDLASYGPAGYCGDVLEGPDAGHPQTVGCAALAMCCNEVDFPPSTLATCQDVVSGNDDGNCASAYDAYATLGYCD